MLQVTNRHLIYMWPLLLALLLAGAPALAQTEDFPTVDEYLAQCAAFFGAKAAAHGVVREELAAEAEALSKTELIKLQLTLETFAGHFWIQTPDGPYTGYICYPQHINQLVQPRFYDKSDVVPHAMAQAGFYPNPYTAQADSGPDAQEIPFGWTEQAPGNFTYLQHYNERGEVVNYVLLVYAYQPGRGMDVTGDGRPDGVAYFCTNPFQPLTGKQEFLSGGRRVTLVLPEQPRCEPAPAAPAS